MRRLRRALFAALAAWILFSPGLAQLAGIELPFVRPWIMFKDVGIGVLKGDFVATSLNGAEVRLTPLQVLGRSRYPIEAQPYRFENRVFADKDVKRFVADYCARQEGRIADLRFEGRVGAGPSWRPLVVGGLCERA